MHSEPKFEQRLRRTARTLPVTSPPSALRARVLEDLPPLERRSRPRTPARAALAGLSAVALGVLLIAGPRLVQPALAAQVRAAILRANTWHFVGWRLQDGRQVRWEVWGRRAPFFYREQVGDEVFLDDGRQATHLLPPDARDGRARGVCLVLPSRSQTGPLTSDGSPGANFLVGLGGDSQNFVSRTDAADGATTLESKTQYFGSPTAIQETVRLTVDRATKLPTGYVVLRSEAYPKGAPGATPEYRGATPFREYVQAVLTPSYDVPLPPSVASVPRPPDYAPADATAPPANLEASAGSVASRGGLTVRAEVLGQDAEGDLHLRFHGWVGSQPIRFGDSGLRLDGLLASGVYGVNDQGRPYVNLDMPGGLIGTRDGGLDLWAAPVEPTPPGGRLPATYDLTTRFSVSRYERMGQSGRSIPVLTESLSFHVPLPTQTADLRYREAAEAVGQEGVQVVGHLASFATEVAEHRALYYATEAQPPDYGRAAFWYGVAARGAARDNNALEAGTLREDVNVMRRLQRH